VSCSYDERHRASAWRKRLAEAERLLAEALDRGKHPGDPPVSDDVIHALYEDVKRLRQTVQEAERGFPITAQDEQLFKWRRQFGAEAGWPLSRKEAAALATREAKERRLSVVKQEATR
jgi:hypothetical protein